jgi:hypothetical protein
VVFIAGAGRSGSTLLGSLLARRPATLHVGELFYLWDRGLTDGWRCGCGTPVPACPLWRTVVSTTSPPVVPHRLVDVRERHLRVRQLRRLQRHVVSANPPHDLLELASTTERLIRGAAEATGADLVIDSSKRPAAALLLHHLTSLDVRVVHLVRDPRAVAHSWSRPKWNPADGGWMPHRSIWGSSLDWLAMNWAVDRYLSPTVPTLRISYEDLVSDTQTTLDLIWAHLGRPASPGGPTIPEHTVSGNPSRFTSSDIVPDMGWVRQSPVRTKRLVTIATAPLLGRYGYRVAPITTRHGVDAPAPR